MTILPTFAAGHDPTAAELDTWRTGIIRAAPLKGVVLIAATSLGATSGTTELAMSKYDLTGLSLVTNRYYMAVYSITFTASVSSDQFAFKVRANTSLTGTQVAGSGFNPTQGSGGNCLRQDYLIVGDSSYTALYLSMQRQSGTGVLTYYGSSGGTPTIQRAWMMLYDLGDSDQWTQVT